MQIDFYFETGSLSSSFVTSGAKLTEVYYNNLKAADNSFTCTIPYNQDIANAIKVNLSNNTKVVISNNGANYFTGYLRKTANFVKTQKNEPISIEIVSAGYLLSCNPDHNYVFENKTVLELAAEFLAICNDVNDTNITANWTHITNNPIIDIVQLTTDNDVAEELEKLLFCYGYSYDFNANGVLIPVTIFDEAPESITQTFSGSNCLEKIQQSVKEETNSKVEISYKETKLFRNTLLFSDTTGAEGDYKCKQEIQPYTYFGDTDSTSEEGDDKSVYCEYDNTNGEVITCTSLTSVDIQYDNRSGIQQTCDNAGEKAKLKIYNNSSSSRFITKLDLYGDAYVVTSENISICGSDSKKTYEYSADYIHNKLYADNLAKSLLDYNHYADYSVTLKSKTNYLPGTFVTVSDTGLGTITGRIVKKVSHYQSGIYDYTIEAVSEYTPSSETTIEKTKTVKNSIIIDRLADIVQETAEQVANLSENPSVYTSITSCGVAVDDNNTVKKEQIVEIEFHVKQGDKELPFVFDETTIRDNLPSGYSFTVNSNKLTLKIQTGITVSTQELNFPIIFTSFKYDFEYCDENDYGYTDQDGSNSYGVQQDYNYHTTYNVGFSVIGVKSGRYIGAVAEVQGDRVVVINSSGTTEKLYTDLFIGDYFVFMGSSDPATIPAVDEVSPQAKDGIFYASRLYTFLGVSSARSYVWDTDSMSQHCGGSLSDALSVANEQLSHNNSDVTQFLDHLTANSIFVKKLVANEAFINRLASSIITLQKDSNGKGGLIKSLNYNGTVDENGNIDRSHFGDVGWAIDNNGLADFSDMNATGGTFTEINVKNGKFSGELNCGVLKIYKDSIKITEKHFEKDETSGSDNNGKLLWDWLTPFLPKIDNQTREYNGSVVGLFGANRYLIFNDEIKIVSIKARSRISRAASGHLIGYDENNTYYYMSQFSGGVTTYMNEGDIKLIYEQGESTILDFSSLPETDPHSNGIAWNNNGILTISNGE